MNKDVPIELLATVIPYTDLPEQGKGEDLYKRILVVFGFPTESLASRSHLGGFVTLLDNLTTLCVVGISTQDEQTALGIKFPREEEQVDGHTWLIPGFYYTDHNLSAARISDPANPEMITTVSIPPTLPLKWSFITFPEAQELWWGTGEDAFAFRTQW